MRLDNAGMSLAALNPILPPIDAGKRYFSRARLNLPARLVTFNGTTPCTLIDLSRSGAKLGSGECPKAGSMVVVEGLPLELFGSVRWAVRGFFGLAFDAPLPLDRVVSLRYYADDEAERQKQAVISQARSWVTGVY